MQAQLNIQRILREKYLLIKVKNPRYSIRSYAKKIGIAAGTLSLIMLGKRKVSMAMAKKIADNLSLDPQERSEIMIESFQEMKGQDINHYMQLSSDQFNLISQWYHFAILNLLETKNFQFNPRWIAQRLDLPVKTINESLESLIRLGMLQQDEDGNLRRSKLRYRTIDDVSSVAVRSSHMETFQLAQKALQECPVNQRDYTSLTLSFDLKKMSKAKELIRKFQDEFLEMMEKDANPEEVFRLSIQLFPLSKISKKEK